MLSEVAPDRQSDAGCLGKTSRRAIVYEDDEACGYTLAAMLRRAGYEVLATGHFEAALRALESSRPPELLVADIVAPPGQVSGLAMARMGLMKHLALKVIYVTGYDLPNVKPELSGPLLRKPVTEEVLLTAMRQVLGDPREQ